MSDTLTGAATLSVSTREDIDRSRGGVMRTVTLTRDIKVRRPDRLWFRATGDVDLEGYYDAKTLTIMSHDHKVFGVMPMPPTLDETVEALHVRYDIPLPVGDLLTKSPREVLMSTQTTGGWARQETIDGRTYDVLDWSHPNVEWTIWIPSTGEPLPRRLEITSKVRKSQPRTTVEFSNWNLGGDFPDATFTASVPADYEGIPVIQRASGVIPHLPADDADAADAPQQGVQ